MMRGVSPEIQKSRNKAVRGKAHGVFKERLLNVGVVVRIRAFKESEVERLKGLQRKSRK